MENFWKGLLTLAVLVVFGLLIWMVFINGNKKEAPEKFYKWDDTKKDCTFQPEDWSGEFEGMCKRDKRKKQLICWSGGGIRAIQTHLGVLTALGEDYKTRTNPRGKSDIIGYINDKFSIMSGNSGGTWFQTLLTFAPGFADMIDDHIDNFSPMRSTVRGAYDDQWVAYIHNMYQELHMKTAGDASDEDMKRAMTKLVDSQHLPFLPENRRYWLAPLLYAMKPQKDSTPGFFNWANYRWRHSWFEIVQNVIFSTWPTTEVLPRTLNPLEIVTYGDKGTFLPNPNFPYRPVAGWADGWNADNPRYTTDYWTNDMARATSITSDGKKIDIPVLYEMNITKRSNLTDNVGYKIGSPDCNLGQITDDGKIEEIEERFAYADGKELAEKIYEAADQEDIAEAVKNEVNKRLDELGLAEDELKKEKDQFSDYMISGRMSDDELRVVYSALLYGRYKQEEQKNMESSLQGTVPDEQGVNGPFPIDKITIQDEKCGEVIPIVGINQHNIDDNHMIEMNSYTGCTANNAASGYPKPMTFAKCYNTQPAAKGERDRYRYKDSSLCSLQANNQAIENLVRAHKAEEGGEIDPHVGTGANNPLYLAAASGAAAGFTSSQEGVDSVVKNLTLGLLGNVLWYTGEIITGGIVELVKDVGRELSIPVALSPRVEGAEDSILFGTDFESLYDKLDLNPKSPPSRKTPQQRSNDVANNGIVRVIDGGYDDNQGVIHALQKHWEEYGGCSEPYKCKIICVSSVTPPDYPEVSGDLINDLFGVEIEDQNDLSSSASKLKTYKSIRLRKGSAINLPGRSNSKNMNKISESMGASLYVTSPQIFDSGDYVRSPALYGDGGGAFEYDPATQVGVALQHYPSLKTIRNQSFGIEEGIEVELTVITTYSSCGIFFIPAPTGMGEHENNTLKWMKEPVTIHEKLSEILSRSCGDVGTIKGNNLKTWSDVINADAGDIEYSTEFLKRYSSTALSKPKLGRTKIYGEYQYGYRVLDPNANFPGTCFAVQDQRECKTACRAYNFNDEKCDESCNLPEGDQELVRGNGPMVLCPDRQYDGLKGYAEYNLSVSGRAKDPHPAFAGDDNNGGCLCERTLLGYDKDEVLEKFEYGAKTCSEPIDCMDDLKKLDKDELPDYWHVNYESEFGKPFDPENDVIYEGPAFECDCDEDNNVKIDRTRSGKYCPSTDYPFNNKFQKGSRLFDIKDGKYIPTSLCSPLENETETSAKFEPKLYYILNSGSADVDEAHGPYSREQISKTFYEDRSLNIRDYKFLGLTANMSEDDITLDNFTALPEEDKFKPRDTRFLGLEQDTEDYRRPKTKNWKDKCRAVCESTAEGTETWRERQRRASKM